MSVPRSLPYGDLPSRDPDERKAAAVGRFAADNWIVDQFPSGTDDTPPPPEKTSR